MKKPLINVADAETHAEKCGERFEYSMTELSHALGAKAIGANLTRVPPGKAAFPFHHHAANEEHFFVISGYTVATRNCPSSTQIISSWEPEHLLLNV